MEIKFTCPQCGALVQDDIENASYDPSAERVSDGFGFAGTVVQCKNGDEFDVELTAHPTGKTVYIRDNPDVMVEFEDDTHSDDGDDRD